MAVRERPAGFRGGVVRWVSREEAVEIARQVAALRTVDDLAQWADGRPGGAVFLVYRLRLAGGDDVLGDEHRREALFSAIVGLAALRRRDAIKSYARERWMRVSTAVGTDGSDRSLARCPTCDVAINLGIEPGVYCRDHHLEQEAEVAGMLGGKGS